MCGGNTGQLVFTECSVGWLGVEALAERAKSMDEILVIHDAALSLERNKGPVTIHDNVIAVTAGLPGVLQTRQMGLWVEWPADLASGRRMWTAHNGVEVNWDHFMNSSLHGLSIETIARAWGTSLEDVVGAMDERSDDVTVKREIGMRHDSPVVLNVMSVLRRPT
jgi:hypothetical protein